MGDTTLAYAIDQADTDWRWRVFNVDGELVAGGFAPTRPEAESAAIHIFAQPPHRRRMAGNA
ncbi:hypothetical protein [Phenylobacterium sp.]|uniref:hypothetical protein n=1 Tax=Phenylobacterium sp. TaxID=1871053 RepID=UPI00286D0903|nr:hypothetical protein [Phenylobacterium sp.]